MYAWTPHANKTDMPPAGTSNCTAVVTDYDKKAISEAFEGRSAETQTKWKLLLLSGWPGISNWRRHDLGNKFWACNLGRLTRWHRYDQTAKSSFSHRVNDSVQLWRSECAIVQKNAEADPPSDCCLLPYQGMENENAACWDFVALLCHLP